MSTVFDGRNILPGFPDELAKMVTFLNEKVIAGEFQFSDNNTYWAKNESIISPLGFGHEGSGYYFAVSLAYIATLNNGIIVFTEKDHVWRWAWSFHLLAGIARWKPDFMQRVIQSFEGKADNIEGLMNWSTQIYAYAYYDDAVELMKSMPQYKVSIMAGLMENDFNRYCAEYNPSDNVDEFAKAFVKANQIKKEDVAKAFDISLSFTSFTSSAAMAFFLSILGKVDEERGKKCEGIILGLLDHNTTLYVTPICSWVYMGQEVTGFEEECILALIKGLDCEKKESSLKAIDHSIGIHLKDPDKLAKVFICIAENLLPTDILNMEGCLHSLYEHKDNFRDMVLMFVMHPKGVYRIAGRRLWDNYHMELSDFNVCDLDETLQCVFVISMLQDFGNPETRLPKLLPILVDGSEKAKSVLMNSLRPYLDDYMGHVINTIDKLKINNKYTRKIKKYFEGRSHILHMRREMKELSPLYTDNMVFREAMRQQREHFHLQMKESEESYHPAWKDMLTTVAVARGGGWREKDGTTRHIPVTTFSAPARQMTESLSPKEQHDWIEQLMKDWDDTKGDS